jgi:hypothetical protein
MRKTILSFAVLFFALIGQAQNLTITQLTLLTISDSTKSIALLQEAKWKPSTSTRTKGALMFAPQSSSSKDQVTVSLDATELNTVRYHLKSEAVLKELYAQALSANYTELFKVENEREAVQYLLRNEQVLMGFHTVKDPINAQVKNYIISVGSLNTWMLSEMAPISNKTWSKDERADFMKSCFKGALANTTATLAKKGCSCMLQTFESQYTDSEAASKALTKEQISEISKKCAQQTLTATK